MLTDYARVLGNLKEQGEEQKHDEVVVILVRAESMSMCCQIFPITKESFDGVLTKEELRQTRYAFSKEHFRCEEWDAVRNTSIPT